MQRNPNFGRGAIGQSSPVNTTNLGLPQTHTGLGQQHITNRNTPTVPMQNLYYPPPNANDASTGRTLHQDQTTRPLIVPIIKSGLTRGDPNADVLPDNYHHGNATSGRNQPAAEVLQHAAKQGTIPPTPPYRWWV